MNQLDRIDLNILRALANNARITNKSLAEKIGIAPSTCLERVRLLQVNHVLKGFHAEIDLSAVGLKIHAMITIRLEVHSKEIFEDFYNHALQLPEVMSVYHLSGANDFMVRVAINDTNNLRDFVLNSFAQRKEVSHIETSLIYAQTQKYHLPQRSSSELNN